MWKWNQLGFMLITTAMVIHYTFNAVTHDKGCSGEMFREELAQQHSDRSLRNHREQRELPEPLVQLYHYLERFALDYRKMEKNFKVFVYPDAFDNDSAFAEIFMPLTNPYDRKLGNFFSEHMFKINLLNSSFVTKNPSEAHLFFLPFSINAMRNDRRIRSEAAIAKFVENYVGKISQRYRFWNRSEGVDHFYVGCHSVGRNAAANSRALWQNAIQVACSANYYQKLYVPHKDVALPQVWPRSLDVPVVPATNRTRLAFFSGRAQNSRVRETLLRIWSNDSDMDISDRVLHGSYEEAFSRSKFCLHVKGYEVNTARISDALHFGCVPVIISNQYDLPLANVINWRSFSLIISYTQISSLKAVLQGISDRDYARLHANVRRVKRHFVWHPTPRRYDSFHMTMYELWLRRHFVRPPL